MGIQNIVPFYDPLKTYDDNFSHGPFTTKQSLFKSPEKGTPKYKFLGKKIYSPFGIPAGPLLNSNFVKFAFDLGFDVICYKTQRSDEFSCNQFPNVLFVDVEGDLTLDKAASPLLGKSSTQKSQKNFSITNSFGNPSKGPSFWVEDLKKALSYQSPGQLLIMSVVGTIKKGFTDQEYFNDFADTAEIAAKAGAEAIEVNLSCPNVASEGVLCYTKNSVIEICRKIKERIGNKPLIAKFGYFSGEQQELLESIVKDASKYLAAISAINTISAPIVNDRGKQALPGPNRLKSGVCGASIKWAGIDMVKRLVNIRDKFGLDFEIIGVGGVMDAEDFQDYVLAGANVVQSATGAMWNPLLAQEVKATL